MLHRRAEIEKEDYRRVEDHPLAIGAEGNPGL